MKAIEIKDLVKDYGKFRAVKGVTLDVDEGDIFGIIGPNGAGKTTVLRIISTLLQITSGTVKVFGYDVAGQSSEVRKVISYLPEEAGAYKDVSGKYYLKFIAGFFRDRGDIQKIVDKGIEIADLGDRINEKVNTYSKGMVRRLLVARALMIDPRLAILDEPTSGLDVINAHEIRKIIQDYSKKGTSVLLSSHNMLEVEFLCNRIALINEGRIVEFGKPIDLKEKYRAQNIEEVFTKVVA